MHLSSWCRAFWSQTHPRNIYQEVGKNYTAQPMVVFSSPSDKFFSWLDWISLLEKSGWLGGRYLVSSRRAPCLDQTTISRGPALVKLSSAGQVPVRLSLVLVALPNLLLHWYHCDHSLFVLCITGRFGIGDPPISWILNQVRTWPVS